MHALLAEQRGSLLGNIEQKAGLSVWLAAR